MTLAQLFLDAVVATDGRVALDPAKLAAATRAFDAALQSGDPATVTHELLTVAFFLEVKKNARPAALELVAVARRAVPVLTRAGVAFDDVAGQAERKSAALLGHTASKVVGQKPEAGTKWWQIR